MYVRGNHDKACSGITDAEDFNHIAALAAFWTKQKLTPENLEWVRALPQGPITTDGVAGVQCVHGSPIHEDEYIIVVRDAYEPLTETEAILTFFGHTHIQGGFAVDGEEWLTLRPIYKTRTAGDVHLPAEEDGEVSDQSRFRGTASRRRLARCVLHLRYVRNTRSNSCACRMT